MARIPLDDIPERVDPAADRAILAHQRLLQEEVRQAVAQLDCKSWILQHLAFGLGGAYSYTLAEIGRIIQRNDAHYVR